MLYKYYRYLLIVKIVLLVLGGYMLLHERDVSTIQGGTLFMVDQQPNEAVNHLDKTLEQNLPMPWAFVSTFSGIYSVQIPWTYDTGYVVRYIKRPIPINTQFINKDTYENNCQKKVYLTEYKGWKVEECNLGIHYNKITAIILVALGLIL